MAEQECNAYELTNLEQVHSRSQIYFLLAHCTTTYEFRSEKIWRAPTPMSLYFSILLFVA